MPVISSNDTTNITCTDIYSCFNMSPLGGPVQGDLVRRWASSGFSYSAGRTNDTLSWVLVGLFCVLVLVALMTCCGWCIARRRVHKRRKLNNIPRHIPIPNGPMSTVPPVPQPHGVAPGAAPGASTVVPPPVATVHR
ncbi:hypothetical protein PFICI_04296 [Pestalotiopsis fici W106-1]|uniref:Uncharacterized protein n=1 Tax=Pestalotiopsis fici (strain W106-1 / CGMCC3.15140) TaxID=1229662 RepID=W3X8P8_PESFW|nr:uncharacterized protein PFICI_04296 [Pestalotiopsis fici W106-1]ETS82420.1 hypothetical protein PFICI_04296 [Pestalotiopsis fici W106-1]